MTRSRFLHQPAAGAISTAILGSLASHAAGSHGHLIVDTHQHLWDLSTQNLPWLEGVPAILNHSYRTAEYLEATQGLNIKTVYMEVDVAPDQEAAEAQWAVDLIGHSNISV
jgi:L-fuconolactonase